MARRHTVSDGLVGLAVLAYVGSVLSVPGLGGGWIGLEVLLAVVGVRIARSVVDRRRIDDAGRDVLVVGGQLVGILVFVLGWTYGQDGTLTGAVQRATGAAVLQVYNVGLAAGDVDGRAFAELWPVSLIAQFAVGMVVVSVLTVRWSMARRGGVLAAMAAAVVVGRAIHVGIGGDSVAAGVLPWFRFDGLLIGAAAGVVVLRRPAGGWLHDASFVGAVWLVGAALVLPPRARWSEPNQLLALPMAAVAAAAVVVAIGAGCAPAIVTRVLAFRPLQFVGRRWIAVALSCQPVGVMLAAGGRPGWHGWSMLGGQLAFIGFAAWASYELIERPLGAAHAWLVRRRTRTA